MSFIIKKAERKQAKIRIGLSAPSGSGKTYSALRLAKGIVGDWEKIVVIDTENDSSSLYAPHFGGYSTLVLDAPYSPERYIEAIRECEKAGFELIIIDSISHEWEGEGGITRSNELIAQTRFKGNTWSAWSVTKPKHDSFVQAILTSSCHIITTIRNKQETVQEGGRVKKIGTKEITSDDFEYALTVNLSIDRDTHLATASKDRTELFENRDPFLITEETGEKIKIWAESGKPSLNSLIGNAQTIEEFNKLIIECQKEGASDSTKASLISSAKKKGFEFNKETKSFVLANSKLEKPETKEEEKPEIEENDEERELPEEDRLIID